MAQLQIGDIVFIAIDNPLYRRVAAATSSWTSHVGIIVDEPPGMEIVAESSFPLSRRTPLLDFKARSQDGRYSIKRLKRPLSKEQKRTICLEADKRMGILYHSGFDLDSKRQFCSKFVYEVFKEASRVEIGEIVTFRALLAATHKTPMWFWRLWYFGFIPWDRRTVTPASQYTSPLLITVEEQL